jgi:hypothetical protein
MTEGPGHRTGHGLIDDTYIGDTNTEGATTERATTAGVERDWDDASGPPQPPSGLSRLLEAATGVVVALCLAAAVVHVLLVFLFVAPSNTISQRYDQQINAWVYPLFEQNWLLFAPDPESANRQIAARTMRTSVDGTRQVSDWFDLTAVDNSAIRHNFFPSHTSQNMLRRAWTAYIELYARDDQPHSERALMVQKYLRNLAVDRVTEYRGGAFDAIQLRVITTSIGAPDAPVNSRPAVDTRYLPWWQVVPDGD